jgi:hypothetical protein
MVYMIKIGTQYLTADGSLTDRQCDAVRVTADRASSIRVVKLRPRASSTLDTPTVGSAWDDDPTPADASSF